MTLRARIALLAAAAVAVSIVIAAAVAFAATRSQLRGEVDESLLRFAGQGAGRLVIRRAPFEQRMGTFGPMPVEPPDELLLTVQFLSPEGDRMVLSEQTMTLPVTAEDLSVAAGDAPAVLRDVIVGGEHLRMITAPVPSVDVNGVSGAGAVQVARSLAEVDASLRGLGLVLVVVALGGVGLATGLGLFVARSALRPVAKLTAAAEAVAKTQDLDAPIVVDRHDEIGRLARSFNAMLRALKESRAQQQQLVADASHELRTPLTSLRTNIEMLVRNDEMEAGERTRLLADLNLEMEELSDLVAELVELATTPEAADEEERSDVRLDEIVGTVVERARRRTGQRIDFEGRPGVVQGRPSKLERAAANLVDNACKWNTNGSPVEVCVDGGRLEVRDHGPGIDDEDLPHVFDRFYRSPSARSMPGSGLGLAIVKQIVEAHGGRAWAKRADDGGALVGFELPETS